MHTSDGLLDRNFCELQLTAASRHLMISRRRVSQDLPLVIAHALLAQRLVVTHAEHVDRLVMLSTNCVLLPLGQWIHAAAHLVS